MPRSTGLVTTGTGSDGSSVMNRASRSMNALPPKKSRVLKNLAGK